MKETILGYLQTHFTEPVRDPLWRNIYLTPGHLKLIGSEKFQQLGRIRQLGPAFHIYPGAVHTRLNHSLGVFQTAKKEITSLIILSQESDIQSVDLSLTGIRSFLSAALLHDLGHFPFAHSLKELPLIDHEKLGGEFILSDKTIYTTLQKHVGADPEMTAAIIDTSILSTDKELLFYRNLLSGTLDPDKLDYLNRDAYFCGVPYGIQDVDFIIDRLRIVNDGKLGILENGIGAIEHLLFSKYLMYRNVYWHRTVRSATAMIKKALTLALTDSVLTPERLYGLDDESFNNLCSSSSCECTSLELIQKVMHRDLMVCAFEIPFDPQNKLHHKLQDLSARTNYEERLRSRINSAGSYGYNPWDIIIDIPENISFETSLPVIGKNGHLKTFSQTGPVFSAPVIKSFTDSLRKIRVFTPAISVDNNLLSDLIKLEFQGE
ncbi:MAG: HD domain-containing protein [Bacteroidetes bacterium]|nr:HD domain-containing protein [Bacteroidota bacterium]